MGMRAAAAVALLDEHCGCDADHARALWTLLVLDEWLAWASRRVVAAEAAPRVAD